MRSKADETLVIVETLICPLQISHLNPHIFDFVKCRGKYQAHADCKFFNLSLFHYF